MFYIGMDIGTTTVSAVLAEEGASSPIKTLTRAHNGALQTDRPWEKTQDITRIEALVCQMLKELCADCGSVAAIGLTGQMHGFVYTDQDGKAVSNLYTWQDERGNLPMENGHTLVQSLHEVTSAPVASGYGLVTHLWNVRHGAVPRTARYIATAASYIGMRLCGCKTPVLHTSDAAGLGFFQVNQGCFDRIALHTCGLDDAMIPQVTASANLLGRWYGIPVVVGIGDNQASYLGTVDRAEASVLVNMGTGAQISVYSKAYMVCEDCETRPYVDGGYIVAGSSLCGGRAFAILERFLRSCGEFCGVKDSASLYDRMQAAAAEPIPSGELPTFVTTYCGTRKNALERASITGLSEDNFTPGNLIRATLEGIVDELHRFYNDICPALQVKPTTMYCSGNLIRLNPVIQEILHRKFGMVPKLSGTIEEAAWGAAIFARRRLKT